jgi:hypothetical protein
MDSWVGFSHSRNFKLLSGTTPSGAAMTKKNTNPTGAVCTRQSSIAHSASSRITFILVALLLFPTVVFGYPFHLTWSDVNADEDGTIIYREISGVFHEVGFVGPNVTSFTDDPPGADGDIFCWTVRAFREGDISGSSNETCAKVPAPSKSGERRAQRQ